MSNPWISTSTLRRRPVSGPILLGCFRGIFASLVAGAMATLFFGLSTNSPIGQSAGSLGTLLWLLLPYPTMLVCAWWWIGGGVWRGLSFLVGSLALTGAGLFHVAHAWFFVPPEAATDALRNLGPTQWSIIAGSVVLAVVPGLLIRRGLDQIDQSGTNQPPPSARDLPPLASVPPAMPSGPPPLNPPRQTD